MNRILAATLLLVPLAAGAYSTGTALGGTTTTINAGSGNQTDPHVSGDLAAYTSGKDGTSEIRYFDFVRALDQSIPGGAGAVDFLSDVSGPIVVFTRVEVDRQSIWSFDTSTSGPAVELAPVAASNRRAAAIGGNTVAWQDLGFSSSTTALSEIVAYDRTSGATARLTDDGAFDRNVAVAPSGDVVVWEKCAFNNTPCDIWQAVKGAAGWTASPVTSTPDPESFADTNGTLVVYGANRAGNATGLDIYWTPVAGGAESQLALDGDQRNPNVSGNVIAFEGRSAADATPNWDLYFYDLTTQTLYRLTNTPDLDERLNDVSVTGAQVRLVWSVLEADQNVYGYTFTLEGEEPDGGSGGGGGGGGGEDERPCLTNNGWHKGQPTKCDRGNHFGQYKVRKASGVSVSPSGVQSLGESGAAGCSSSSGGIVLAGVLALLALLVVGRRPTRATIRRDRK